MNQQSHERQGTETEIDPEAVPLGLELFDESDGPGTALDLGGPRTTVQVIKHVPNEDLITRRKTLEANVLHVVSMQNVNLCADSALRLRKELQDYPDSAERATELALIEKILLDLTDCRLRLARTSHHFTEEYKEVILHKKSRLKRRRPND